MEQNFLNSKTDTELWDMLSNNRKQIFIRWIIYACSIFLFKWNKLRIQDALELYPGSHKFKCKFKFGMTVSGIR